MQNIETNIGCVSFLNNYEVDEDALVESSSFNGYAKILYAQRDGMPYLIKCWSRDINLNDRDLEDIWRHELRQLHRLRGYPGVGDYIPTIVDSGQDNKGFYLVLDAHERLPLSYSLKPLATLKLRPHWINKLNRIDARILFWKNIIRIAKAIQLLHSQGLLHRNIDENSILTSSIVDETIPDFQLTGFEWALRIGSRTIINHLPLEDLNNYSFASDWSDLGQLLASLLKLDINILLDLEQNNSQLAALFQLTIKEIVLLKALINQTQVELEGERLTLNGQAIEKVIDQIIQDLQGSISKVRECYDIAISLYVNVKSGMNLFYEIQKKYKEIFDITLSSNDEDKVKEFIIDDLSDTPMVFLDVNNKNKVQELYLCGKTLSYKLKKFRPNLKVNEFIWDIAQCNNVSSDFSRLKGMRVIILEPENIKIHIERDARAAYRKSMNLLSQTSWSAIISKFDECDEVRTGSQKKLIEGLAACHLTNILYARTEIFPIKIIDKKEIPEEGVWQINVSSDYSAEAEELSKSLSLDPPAKRLEKLLTNNKMDTDKWSLTQSQSLAKESEEIYLIFQEHIIDNQGQQIYVFTSRQPITNISPCFIAPDSLVGTTRQLTRHARALDTFATHSELMNTIIHPQQYQLETQDNIPKEQTYYQNLDTSKQKIFSNILQTLPIHLVQGPPGVGKTHLVATLIRHIFTQEVDSRVLLSAQSHATVQHLYSEIIKILPKSIQEKILIIQCNKQDKDDGMIFSDIDEKSQKYLKQLVNSDLFKKSSTQHIKDDIIEMTSGHQSRRYSFSNQLLRSANMVFATTNSEPIHQMVKNKAQFDWSIIEEAGKITGIELIGPLLLSHRRLMIGDHQQLPPYHATEIKKVLLNPDKLKIVLQNIDQVYNIRVTGEIIKTELDASSYTTEQIKNIGVDASRYLMLFETLVKDEEIESENYKAAFGSLENRLSIGDMLSVQYRMHPYIAKLISNTFYNEELKTDVDKEYHYLNKERPFNFGQVEALQKTSALTWIDIPDVQATKNMKEGESLPIWNNKKEREIIVKLLKLLQVNDESKKPKLAILSPYAEQVTRLEKDIQQISLDNFSQPDDKVSFCSTVDGFQGSEADLVIVSLARNNSKAYEGSALGFLTDSRRMNVLLSRARYQLIIVGSYQFIKAWAEKISKSPTTDNGFFPKLILWLESFKKDGQFTIIPLDLISSINLKTKKKDNKNWKKGNK